MDSYKTLNSDSQGLYKVKGSKFLSFAHPVSSEDEIKELIQYYRKEYHDARHHCFAWEIGVDGNHYRANDDGEPSGTAGKPILGQIHSFEVTNILIMVVRYFGGTKLGVGGLIQAYKSAAADALENADIIEKTIDNYYRVTFNYENMNDVMKLVKDEDLKLVNQNFELDCTLDFCIRKNDSKKVEDKLSKMYEISYKYLYSV